MHRARNVCSWPQATRVRGLHQRLEIVARQHQRRAAPSRATALSRADPSLSALCSRPRRIPRRRVTRIARESEQKRIDERADLERQLTEHRSKADAKLRAERQRLAVRYTNQGKTLVQQKLSAARRDFEQQLGGAGPSDDEPPLRSREQGLDDEMDDT